MAKKTPETNPFVQALEIHCIWRMEFEQAIATDEYTTEVRMAKAKLIETDDRASLYTAGLLSWFTDLSTSAKDMFMYIATKIGWEKDVIELDEETYCDVMKVSRNTFYNAKTQLTNRLLVPRTSRKNTYWVNPSYIFKGNRHERFKDRVIKTNENPLNQLTGAPKIKPSLYERAMAD